MGELLVARLAGQGGASMVEGMHLSDPEGQVTTAVDPHVQTSRLFGQEPDQPPTRARDLARGHVLADRFKIVSLLGQGGMGSVYKGQDLRLRRTVAIKTLSPQLARDPAMQARFEREAQAASCIQHRNVVEVFDCGVDDGMPFIVMEYLRGHDLADVLAHGRLGVQRTADLILGVCAGVFAAHERGVVHRDLKPQNIFIVPAGAGEMVKVLDFGVSHVEGGTTLTGRGDIVGTVHYLSPEQIEGGEVTAACDQFALGVLIYRCVTGQYPHTGDTAIVVLRNIRAGRIQPPRAQDATLAPAFEEIILRAMARDPSARFPSVHQLGAALLEFASSRAQRQWSDNFACDRPNVPFTTNRPTPRAEHTASLIPTQSTQPMSERAAAAWQLAPTHTRGPGPRRRSEDQRTEAPEPDASPETAARWRRYLLPGLAAALVSTGVVYLVLTAMEPKSIGTIRPSRRAPEGPALALPPASPGEPMPEPPEPAPSSTDELEEASTQTEDGAVNPGHRRKPEHAPDPSAAPTPGGPGAGPDIW